MSDPVLTEEQKKFLEECENEFKDRYSEKDSAFMKIKSMELKKPPIVDPWYNKPRRPPFDWGQQNQGQGRRNHNWGHRHHDKHERVERTDGRYPPYRSHKPY